MNFPSVLPLRLSATSAVNPQALGEENSPLNRRDHREDAELTTRNKFSPTNLPSAFPLRSSATSAVNPFSVRPLRSSVSSAVNPPTLNLSV